MATPIPSPSSSLSSSPTNTSSSLHKQTPPASLHSSQHATAKTTTGLAKKIPFTPTTTTTSKTPASSDLSNSVRLNWKNLFVDEDSPVQSTSKAGHSKHTQKSHESSTKSSKFIKESDKASSKSKDKETSKISSKSGRTLTSSWLESSSEEDDGLWTSARFQKIPEASLKISKKTSSESSEASEETDETSLLDLLSRDGKAEHSLDKFYGTDEETDARIKNTLQLSSFEIRLDLTGRPDLFDEPIELQLTAGGQLQPNLLQQHQDSSKEHRIFHLITTGDIEFQPLLHVQNQIQNLETNESGIVPFTKAKYVNILYLTPKDASAP